MTAIDSDLYARALAERARRDEAAIDLAAAPQFSHGWVPLNQAAKSQQAAYQQKQAAAGQDAKSGQAAQAASDKTAATNAKNEAKSAAQSHAAGVLKETDANLAKMAAAGDRVAAREIVRRAAAAKKAAALAKKAAKAKAKGAKTSAAANTKSIQARAEAITEHVNRTLTAAEQRVMDLAMSTGDPEIIDLAGKWKHGWVPLDSVAMAIKARKVMSGHGGGEEHRAAAPPEGKVAVFNVHTNKVEHVSKSEATAGQVRYGQSLGGAAGGQHIKNALADSDPFAKSMARSGPASSRPGANAATFAEKGLADTDAKISKLDAYQKALAVPHADRTPGQKALAAEAVAHAKAIKAARSASTPIVHGDHPKMDPLAELPHTMIPAGSLKPGHLLVDPELHTPVHSIDHKGKTTRNSGLVSYHTFNHETGKYDEISLNPKTMVPVHAGKRAPRGSKSVAGVKFKNTNLSTTSDPTEAVDLAAINGHHVAGTSFHWHHNWHPTDRATAARWGKEIKGGAFHHVEPEEFNGHAGMPKHVASTKFGGTQFGNEAQPKMKYKASKTLSGHTFKNAKGEKVKVTHVSQSGTHVKAEDGSKHRISELTGHKAEDTAALQAFTKAKYSGAIKQYSIHSAFKPSKKAKPLPSWSKPPPKHGTFKADPAQFQSEPSFPYHKSLASPNTKEPFTASEKAQLVSYTGSAYAGLNSALRSGKTEGYETKIKRMDSALAKATPLPNTGALHRGFTHPGLANLQPGEDFTEHGYVSTSRNHDVGLTKRQIRVHIESTHPDLKALDVSGISNFPSEREVILQRNTKFTVNRRVEHGSHVHYYVHAEPGQNKGQ